MIKEQFRYKLEHRYDPKAFELALKYFVPNLYSRETIEFCAKDKLIRFSKKLSSYPDFDELLDALTSWKEHHIDPSIDIDTWDDYGSSSVKIIVKGWREPTPEEITDITYLIEVADAIKKEEEENRNNWQRQQYEKLKAKFEA